MTLTPTAATLAVISIPMLAITQDIMQAAKEGGSMGGQALLFGALLVLGYVVIALFRRGEKSMMELQKVFVTASETQQVACNAQREEDRRHHEELVQTLRAERATYSESRERNFSTLMKIAADSAVALEKCSMSIVESNNCQKQIASTLVGLTHTIGVLTERLPK